MGLRSAQEETNLLTESHVADVSGGSACAGAFVSQHRKVLELLEYVHYDS